MSSPTTTAKPSAKRWVPPPPVESPSDQFFRKIKSSPLVPIGKPQYIHAIVFSIDSLYRLPGHGSGPLLWSLLFQARELANVSEDDASTCPRSRRDSNGTRGSHSYGFLQLLKEIATPTSRIITMNKLLKIIIQLTAFSPLMP